MPTVASIIAALIAVVQRHEAIRQRNQAIGLKLTSQGQAMLAGMAAGGDAQALQQILAAPQVTPTADPGAPFTGVVSLRDTLKIVQTAHGVLAVAVSPDGQRIVSAGDDHTVRLWDAATGKPIGEPFTGHQARVRAVAFSPDGQRVVSASEDETLRLWPTPAPAAWPKLLCNKLTQNMSHQQWRDWVSPDVDYIAVCPGLPIPADSA